MFHSNDLIVILEFPDEEGRSPEVISGFANEEARSEWVDMKMSELPGVHFIQTSSAGPF